MLNLLLLLLPQGFLAADRKTALQHFNKAEDYFKHCKEKVRPAAAAPAGVVQWQCAERQQQCAQPHSAVLSGSPGSCLAQGSRNVQRRCMHTT